MESQVLANRDEPVPLLLTRITDSSKTAEGTEVGTHRMAKVDVINSYAVALTAHLHIY